MTAYPRWPGDIPQAPNHSGYSESAQANAYSFKPQVGAPISRRLGTYRSSRVSITFEMRTEDIAIFERFFVEYLEEGTKIFKWLHPRKGVDRRWKFDLPQSGDAAYTIAPLDRATGWWTLTFALYELPG